MPSSARNCRSILAQHDCARSSAISTHCCSSTTSTRTRTSGSSSLSSGTPRSSWPPRSAFFVANRAPYTSRASTLPGSKPSSGGRSPTSAHRGGLRSGPRRQDRDGARRSPRTNHQDRRGCVRAARRPADLGSRAHGRFPGGCGREPRLTWASRTRRSSMPWRRWKARRSGPSMLWPWCPMPRPTPSSTCNDVGSCALPRRRCGSTPTSQPPIGTRATTRTRSAPATSITSSRGRVREEPTRRRLQMKLQGDPLSPRLGRAHRSCRRHPCPEHRYRGGVCHRRSLGGVGRGDGLSTASGRDPRPGCRRGGRAQPDGYPGPRGGRAGSSARGVHAGA